MPDLIFRWMPLWTHSLFWRIAFHIAKFVGLKVYSKNDVCLKDLKCICLAWKLVGSERIFHPNLCKWTEFVVDKPNRPSNFLGLHIFSYEMRGIPSLVGTFP